MVVADVGRRANRDDPVLLGLLCHRDTVLETKRAVIEAGEDVTVEVDQAPAQQRERFSGPRCAQPKEKVVVAPSGAVQASPHARMPATSRVESMPAGLPVFASRTRRCAVRLLRMSSTAAMSGSLLETATG